MTIDLGSKADLRVVIDEIICRSFFRCEEVDHVELDLCVGDTCGLHITGVADEQPEVSEYNDAPLTCVPPR